MIAAVVERSLDVDHFVPGQNAAFHRFLDALVDRLNKFLRHRAAHDIVDKFVALARLVRFNTDFGVTVLAAATGLANVFTFRFSLLANRLAIRDLRLAHVGFYFVLAHHAVDDDFQVQLAHSADDGLSAVGIGVNLKSGIFLRQLGQRHAHLFLVSLGLRFNRDVDNRNRELDRLECDGMILVTNRVTGADILQTDSRANVARENLADVFALVGVHLQQTPDTLGASAAGVQHGIA